MTNQVIYVQLELILLQHLPIKNELASSGPFLQKNTLDLASPPHDCCSNVTNGGTVVWKKDSYPLLEEDICGVIFLFKCLFLFNFADFEAPLIWRSV